MVLDTTVTRGVDPLPINSTISSFISSANVTPVAGLIVTVPVSGSQITYGLYFAPIAGSTNSILNVITSSGYKVLKDPNVKLDSKLITIGSFSETPT